ncbi:hypothetical protein PHISP_08572, partial [Aspergillus sp. HF37]
MSAYSQAQPNMQQRMAVNAHRQNMMADRLQGGTTRPPENRIPDIESSREVAIQAKLAVQHAGADPTPSANAAKATHLDLAQR